MLAAISAGQDCLGRATFGAPQTEPFLKWAGGKRWAVPNLRTLVPRVYGTYFEPFLGGGSLFFALRPANAALSDANIDLINAYRVVRDKPDDLERWLERLDSHHDSNLYYRIRSRARGSEFWSALRFIYLNRTCWNGLYRVNKRGEFNVPIGTKTAISYPKGLSDQSSALKGATLEACDFSVTINRANTGDFVYVDPPYTVKHNNNGFVKYNENIFKWDDQERLAEEIASAIKRGVKVLVSNAAHESVRSLYAGIGEIFEVERSSVLAASSLYRKREKEVIIKCY